ncbi:hypothetical protein BCR35DRAFT_50663 [Leucosporidium creatinivorum]|uniref:Uncharacterized protein n=1 Tax=Leucosporidium creatinivorum TaxID=106004 RepID=A0A1Y2FPZ0_9BASI|nr:hypothetical protein BCR35DRAFT_50663 [Leucosporidium creatinivorum]
MDSGHDSARLQHGRSVTARARRVLPRPSPRPSHPTEERAPTEADCSLLSKQGRSRLRTSAEVESRSTTTAPQRKHSELSLGLLLARSVPSQSQRSLEPTAPRAPREKAGTSSWWSDVLQHTERYAATARRALPSASPSLLSSLVKGLQAPSRPQRTPLATDEGQDRQHKVPARSASSGFQN